jgi:hypothetical protein
MSEQAKAERCRCPRCVIAGAMWPVILITLGVIFLLGQYTRYGFPDLFPFLLIVPGVLLVVQAFAPKSGHTGT